MKKYQSIKQIDLTEKPRSSNHNITDSRKNLKPLSHSRSAKKSLSKQPSDYMECLTDRINPKHKTSEFQHQHFNSNLPKTNIKTYIRFKPITNSELMEEGDFGIIQQLDIPNNTTVIYDENTYFTYDKVFQPDTMQKTVYEECGKEIIDSFINGYNGTIFAYGQTGSGKTYTMFGEGEKKGIIPQAIDDIMNQFQENKPNTSLSCSMLEIYRQNMIDLLSEEHKDLRIKETSTGIQVNSLSIHQITTREDIMKLISKGTEMRKIRGTDVNERSSRSHLIFTIYLQMKKGQNQIRKSKLNMVDLAGSEKVSKTKVSGEGLEEAKKINLSLSCLGNTINALSKGQDHIPFRDSKLTRVLQQSLSGNSLTKVIVTCSMDSSCQEETYSSLKFANRVKKIKTGPVQNLQLRSSEQSVNRVMYQTLKSSFRNYEEKINQIKELLCSDLSSISKDEILEMLMMIVNKEDIMDSAQETQRSRRCESVKKAKKQNLITNESNDEYIKELEVKIKDLQTIIIKQEEIIKTQTVQLQKVEKNKIKMRQANETKSKNISQKLKIYKATNQRTKQTENPFNQRLEKILQLINGLKKSKSSYQKMQKQILCRQIEDLMNRLCASEDEKQQGYYRCWKNTIQEHKSLFKELQTKINETLNQWLKPSLRQLGTQIGNVLNSPKQNSSLSRVNSTHKF